MEDGDAELLKQMASGNSTVVAEASGDDDNSDARKARVKRRAATTHIHRGVARVGIL
jgi:hypothetical protein